MHEWQYLPLRRVSKHSGRGEVCAQRRGRTARMTPFTFAKARTEREALDLVHQPNTVFIAGGTTLLDLMKLTRCYYFRDPIYACNKRQPGSGCAALEGFNRIHAVLGGSDQCIATHPSDMAVALVVLQAVVHISRGKGERSVPIEEFHVLPGNTPHIETVLQPGELITHVTVPASNFAPRSAYVKLRDRASYEFALSSAAAALDLQGNQIRSARLALGGVATKPWRSPEGERVLTRGAAVDE